MRNEIQKFISLGDTEKALALLATKFPNDATLLSAQYTSGKKQFNMNLIDYSDWQRIQSKVNYSVLELAGKSEEIDASLANSEPPKIETQHKVFISYNHDDFFAMQSIKSFLETNGVKVVIDTEEVKPGEKFEDFITRALRDNAFILTIVSKNSLLSGWVSKELTASMLLNHLSERQWVPVRIDNEMFEPEFFFSSIAKIDARIATLRDAVQKSLDAKLDLRNFTDELSRQEDLKNNFSKILRDLKERLVVNVTGPLFQPGMGQVLKVIRNGK